MSRSLRECLRCDVSSLIGQSADEFEFNERLWEA